MSKVVQRLLLFFLGLPLIIGLVLLSSFNHIALNMLIVACSAVAAAEVYALLRPKLYAYDTGVERALVIIFSAALPFFTYIFHKVGLPYRYVDFLFVVFVAVVFVKQIVFAKDFSCSAGVICADCFVVFYCGYLLTFISKMTGLCNSAVLIAFFLFQVFICDSSAWLFGVLFGKGNRGLFKVSPNKSIAGFLAGYISVLVSCFLATKLFPKVFGTAGVAYIKMLLTGLIVATSCIAGDLAESVLKRSVNAKDSGALIPGRGGLLDSIDSIVFSAPFYYFCLKVFNIA